MRLFTVAVIIYLFNIPFGYWRANVKKFSLQWVLAIHLPVPFVIALRFMSGLGFAFITYPVLVGAFFTGQFTGSKIFHLFKKNPEFASSSFIFTDIVKFFKSQAIE